MCFSYLNFSSWLLFVLNVMVASGLKKSKMHDVWPNLCERSGFLWIWIMADSGPSPTFRSFLKNGVRLWNNQTTTKCWFVNFCIEMDQTIWRLSSFISWYSAEILCGIVQFYSTPSFIFWFVTIQFMALWKRWLHYHGWMPVELIKNNPMHLFYADFHVRRGESMTLASKWWFFLFCSISFATSAFSITLIIFRIQYMAKIATELSFVWNAFLWMIFISVFVWWTFIPISKWDSLKIFSANLT